VPLGDEAIQPLATNGLLGRRRSVASIRLASPSQTPSSGRGTGVDAERGCEAEVEVEYWREHDRLPLPEFDPGLRLETEGILDYPPRAASDYKYRKGLSKDAKPESTTSSPSILRFARRCTAVRAPPETLCDPFFARTSGWLSLDVESRARVDSK